jgi:hypothetical protein
LLTICSVMEGETPYHMGVGSPAARAGGRGIQSCWAKGLPAERTSMRKGVPTSRT